MRKEFLMKKLERLQNKRSALATRSEGSTDAAEVRSINEQINELNDEINEIDAEIKAIEADERAAEQAQAESRSAVPADAQLVNGTVVNSAHMGVDASQKREGVDSFATMEYRKAFMKYAQTGEAIPANLTQRDGAPANTNTLGATIPTTVTVSMFAKSDTKKQNTKIPAAYTETVSPARRMGIRGRMCHSAIMRSRTRHIA